MTTEDSSCDRTDVLLEEAWQGLNNFLMYQIKVLFKYFDVNLE
jgi:hypothetical protein